MLWTSLQLWLWCEAYVWTQGHTDRWLRHHIQNFFPYSCNDAKNERIFHHVTALRGLSRHVSTIRGLCHHAKAVRVLYLRAKKVKGPYRSVEPPCNDKVVWGMSVQHLSRSYRSERKVSWLVVCVAIVTMVKTWPKSKGRKFLSLHPDEELDITSLNFVCKCRDKPEKSNT